MMERRPAIITLLLAIALSVVSMLMMFLVFITKGAAIVAFIALGALIYFLYPYVYNKLSDKTPTEGEEDAEVSQASS